MKVPLRLAMLVPNLVYKLEKSLYGIKQASCQQNAKLTSVLIGLGYVQSKSNYSLFTKCTFNGFTAILIHVDDLVLSGNNLDEIQHMKSFLDGKFKIKDSRALKFFLGMEVAQSQKDIVLYQRKYTLDFLSNSGMIRSKPITTPMHYALKLAKDSGSPISHILAH